LGQTPEVTTDNHDDHEIAMGKGPDQRHHTFSLMANPIMEIARPGGTNAIQMQDLPLQLQREYHI